MSKEATPPKAQKGASRAARTLRILLMMALLGAGLTVYSIYATARDIGVATGPQSDAQKTFFVDASERPDMAIFFKGMKPPQRLAMSKNIGRYDDPKLAKLIAKLLETFDVAARGALTESLSTLAVKQPKAVAEQLNVGGSFQQLAIRTALEKAGPTAYPIVAERLTDGGARPNAVAFLVASGLEAVPALMPMLDNKDKDVRLAAADALGKIRAKDSVSKLTSLYEGSTGDEHFGYLAAIAGVGDPSSQGLLEAALKDTVLPGPQRSQAALGLGRIASDSAITLLWTYVPDENRQLSQSAVSALQLAGPRSLELAKGTEPSKIRVAQGIKGPLADQVLSLGVDNPQLRLEAARASGDRTSMVPKLAAVLKKVDPSEDGEEADALIAALGTTPSGLTALDSVNNEALKGLIVRRRSLQQ